MRVLFVLGLLCISAVCAAASFSQIKRIADDDALLENAGVSLREVQFRLPCLGAIIETSDPPEFSNYLFVQSSNELNLFSLEDGYLMSELQLKLHNMDGVALQHMGRYSQVQIFSGERVAALYIHDKSWIDSAQTEAVYRWLTDHGVPARDPRKWIGP